MSTDRVELPAVTPTDTAQQHVSLLLIADALRNADSVIAEQEATINKLSQQLQQLQNNRIATIAQKNVLTSLQERIVELENSSKPQQ
jgi:hypothetical protein